MAPIQPETHGSGKRLGRYEILSAIGAGGMGEVYRARDTRLERIVAVKTYLITFPIEPNYAMFRARSTNECKPESPTHLYSLRVLNWFEDLKQKVPTGKK